MNLGEDGKAFDDGFDDKDRQRKEHTMNWTE